jgi:hypothetical protein
MSERELKDRIKYCPYCACGYELPDGWLHDSCPGCRRASLLADALRRAAHVAENLLSHVGEFTGVIGPGGEREDDYIAWQLAEEIREWRKLADDDPSITEGHEQPLADESWIPREENP